MQFQHLCNILGIKAAESSGEKHLAHKVVTINNARRVVEESSRIRDSLRLDSFEIV